MFGYFNHISGFPLHYIIACSAIITNKEKENKREKGSQEIYEERLTESHGEIPQTNQHPTQTLAGSKALVLEEYLKIEKGKCECKCKCSCKGGIHLLSLDGGGSKGLMEAIMLKHIMNLATVMVENPEKIYSTKIKGKLNFT